MAFDDNGFELVDTAVADRDDNGFEIVKTEVDDNGFEVVAPDPSRFKTVNLDQVLAPQGSEDVRGLSTYIRGGADTPEIRQRIQKISDRANEPPIPVQSVGGSMVEAAFSPPPFVQDYEPTTRLGGSLKAVGNLLTPFNIATAGVLPPAFKALSKAGKIGKAAKIGVLGEFVHQGVKGGVEAVKTLTSSNATPAQQGEAVVNLPISAAMTVAPAIGIRSVIKAEVPKFSDVNSKVNMALKELVTPETAKLLPDTTALVTGKDLKMPEVVEPPKLTEEQVKSLEPEFPASSKLDQLRAIDEAGMATDAQKTELQSLEKQSKSNNSREAFARVQAEADAAKLQTPTETVAKTSVSEWEAWVNLLDELTPLERSRAVKNLADATPKELERWKAKLLQVQLMRKVGDSTRENVDLQKPSTPTEPPSPPKPEPTVTTVGENQAGVRVELPELKDNYLKPLKTYASTLFRETSAESAEHYFPNTRTSAPQNEHFVANTENLARGQGGNKGVMLEFDAGNLEGQVNTSKPGWKPAYDSGEAEFKIKYVTPAEVGKNLKSITVRSDAKSSRVGNIVLKQRLADLESKGWIKSKVEGGAKWTRPDAQPTPAAKVEPASAAEETRTPSEILNTSPNVKVKLPSGATMVRVTTEYKGEQKAPTIISKAQLEKGNIFKDAGVVKVEAGTMSGKNFVPTKGDLSIVAPPKKPLASDWTSATEDVAPISEPVKGSPEKSGDDIQELHVGIPIPKFANQKMKPLDKVTTSHSGKLQKSFDESRRAQKEIKREVPTDKRQGAISVWREAGGDIPTLQSWAATAKGKLFKQAAIDAQSLTPKEIAIAQKSIAAFDVLERRGNTYDVLKSHRDNYIPHVWDVKQPGTGLGTGILQQKFKFSKARTFNTFFEGDQAGFKPKTLAIGKLLPTYIHEMNKVIADRQFVRDLAAETASDGRPLVLPRGIIKEVGASGSGSQLVFPRSIKGAKDATGADIEQGDYKTLENQPALREWQWLTKNEAGEPIFMQSDLALHPDAYRRVNAMLGRSAFKQWYNEPVGGMAQVPRAIFRGVDTAQSVMKREMFGLLAPFHQVQEGTHAIGHLVNPFFGLEKIDMRKPNQIDAANHGLMLLPDRTSSRTYMEGVGQKTGFIPRALRKAGKPGQAVADVIDGYQDYLFHQYIPALKLKTYEAMLGRNTKLYAKELTSGEMTPADVKITSAQQANAAYGHLNYALLDRNPTIQHMAQLAMLAPDFLEARVRFAGQGFKGLTSKVGHEQMKAIAILAAAQAGTALVLSQMLGVPYDPHHPFEVIYKGRRYAMRSVPEDIFGLLKDTRQFIYGRVNPLIVKGGVQYATGLNYRGEKTDALETTAELLAGYIPITARSIPFLRNLTESTRNNPVTPLQQLAGSLGLRISRYSPISETYKLAGEWMKSQKLDQNKGSYPISKYQQLRYALEDGDMDRAKSEYEELKATMPVDKISSGFHESVNHPFTDKKSNDEAFAASLNGYEKEIYNLAVRTRGNLLNEFSTIDEASKRNPRQRPTTRSIRGVGR